MIRHSQLQPQTNFISATLPNLTRFQDCQSVGWRGVGGGQFMWADTCKAWVAHLVFHKDDTEIDTRAEMGGV
jgi:hypothetical protein